MFGRDIHTMLRGLHLDRYVFPLSAIQFSQGRRFPRSHPIPSALAVQAHAFSGSRTGNGPEFRLPLALTVRDVHNRMPHNLSDVMTVPAETIARSSAAERMRLHRERRRNGMRSLWVELRVTEIDALVRTGLLKVETRNDPNAIREALYGYLDQTLGRVA